MKNNLYVFFLFFITGLMSCSHHSGLYEHAEKIMSQHPDSVLTLLSTIQDVNDLSEKDRAMYYLLLTEAQNKTYVKPTSDSLIAISTQYFDKTEDWGRKAKAWYYRGRINQDLGDALHAQDYYLKALQDENQINDYILIGRIYSSIGMLYTYQNVYEKALPYQRKALDRFALMQDSVGISYVLRDIGRTFTALEKKDSAIAYYEQALLVCSSRNKPLVYGELASLYIDKGEYLKSYKYIQKVLSSPSKKCCWIPYLTLGKLFHKTNQIDSAYFYLRLCTNSPIIKTRAGAFYYLAQLELEKKHWENYAINQIQYEELRDSINLIKQTESIRKMESLYDYHQAESKFLKAKILLDKMEIRYLYVCLFGGVCLICVVIGVICVYFSMKRKRMKLCEQREKLFVLKKKREEDQIRLEHNEKMIQCLEKQLEESSMAYTEKEKELMALQKLKLEAENQTLKCVKTEKQLLIEKFCMSDIYYRFHLKEEWRPKEEDWKQLFKGIDDAYDNFTHRLMSVAPKLTMTELRVSCLIKANVPPVTIAMLIVTTPTNVSMIRKRLYDKIHSEKGSSEKFDKFIRDF